MATYRHKAVVAGGRQFPIDMLRRDSCWPEDEDDSGVIARSMMLSGLREIEEVKIMKTSSERTPQWTEGRWKSFGWTLTETETRKL